MREIVFDTETTGLDPLQGDRVVEIGCVELLNSLPTGNTFHAYLNPQRDVPAEVVKVHGLTGEFLADKPLFTQVVDDFLTFIGDAPLVAHNAGFDMKFINAELTRAGFRQLDNARAVDTAAMARRLFPGAPASLDALCKRFNVDASNRTLHGALLDSQLLAEVYLELRGGRQTNLAISATAASAVVLDDAAPREFRVPRLHPALPEELQAHEAFLATLKDALWLRLGAAGH